LDNAADLVEHIDLHDVISNPLGWKLGSGCISQGRSAINNQRKKHPSGGQKLNLLPVQKSGEDHEDQNRAELYF
jgi:hypothetical protein